MQNKYLKYLLIALIISTATYFIWNAVFHKQNRFACTQEARLCPDGSSVTRTGPNCEFTICPKAPDQTTDWKAYKSTQSGLNTYTNTQYGFELKYPNNWGIFKTWFQITDGFDGVTLGYGGQGDFLGINVFIFSDKNKLREFSNITKKYLVEKNGISYLIFPNNVPNDEFDHITSTFKFTK